MTPFGQKIIDLCRTRRLPTDELARRLNITAASLTSLLNGYQGAPSPVVIFQIERALDLSRFELEEVKAAARISNTLIEISVAGMNAAAVEFVNLLAQHIRRIPEGRMAVLLDAMRKTIEKL